jgi:SAM-dependent methyltransferase
LVDSERTIVSADRLTATYAGGRVEPERHPKLRARATLRSLLRALVRPPNRVARRNVGHLLRLLSTSSPLVLVIGGASKGNGVEALYEDVAVRLVCFDLQQSPLVQFVADAHQIPLDTASVDAVVIQAVLEHVLEPQRVVAEIHRVLSDRGLVYAETPFMQQVHGGALDFTRFTASGHRYLFRQFDEISSGPVAGPGTQLLWSVDHAARGVFRSATVGRVVKLLFFWLRYLDAVVPGEYATDNATAFYFLGRKSEEVLAPSLMIEYYHGAQRS